MWGREKSHKIPLNISFYVSHPGNLFTPRCILLVATHLLRIVMCCLLQSGTQLFLFIHFTRFIPPRDNGNVFSFGNKISTVNKSTHGLVIGVCRYIVKVSDPIQLPLNSFDSTLLIPSTFTLIGRNTSFTC